MLFASRIEIVRERIAIDVNSLHAFEQRNVRLKASIQNAFIGIPVGKFGPSILWIVILIFEPVPTDYVL